MVGTKKDHPQSLIERIVKYSLQTQIYLEWREATTRNTSVHRFKRSGATSSIFNVFFSFQLTSAFVIVLF